MSGNSEVIRLRIRRQDSPDASPRWEDFAISKQPNMNVISCLQEIARNPVNASGTDSTPIVWEASCLEEVCGACTMVINGRVRQACSALVDELEQPITLEPMSKFPLVRDLLVDRSRIFESLKKVKAWVPIDGTYDLGPGPREGQEEQELAYVLSRCMSCGCCMEACPQYGPQSDFIGVAAVSQVVLFNSHPTGKLNANERLDAIMGPGGIQDCGNAQNCVKVCPKEIPLTDSIARAGRATWKRTFQKLLGRSL